MLLYCLGRNGNTEDIGLENIGLEANTRGLIEVNKHCQTSHPHIYAVGDVIGYPALASTSMEQGRRAIRHALGIPGPNLADNELPFAIYPTLSDLYRHAAHVALAEHYRLTGRRAWV